MMNTEAYTFFARKYDEFMRDIPYEKWAGNIAAVLTSFGVGLESEVLELGCGTGRFTAQLSEYDFKMCGIDLSPSMIKIAKHKHPGIEFKTADMTEYHDDGRYSAIVSVCDSINYLAGSEALTSMFACAARNLKKGGIFVFDLKTLHFYRKLSDNVYTDEIPGCRYIWENEYDESERVNYYYLTFYKHVIGSLWKRHVEEHYQYAFTHDEVCKAAVDAGLVIKDYLNEKMTAEPAENEDRVYYIMERN
ncbi:MAG TPA: class I SAM-dependent methyltransferase [Lachnospiraceae bacterium]|nr:class I SAM-dependent methyltransferase [Lachnospiraceae bacterium]